MATHKQLEMDEYSHDRQKAELEKRGIKFINEDDVINKFKKLIKELEEQKMAKRGRKGKGLVAAVRAQLQSKVTDFNKIAERTGASLGTVKAQYYRYKKEKGKK